VSDRQAEAYRNHIYNNAAIALDVLWEAAAAGSHAATEALRDLAERAVRLAGQAEAPR